jgi:hypothetical protein
LNFDLTNVVFWRKVVVPAQPFLESRNMKKDYRFLNSSNLTPPPFFTKLTKAVADCWDSMGSVGCKVSETGDKNYEVMFFPALREIYGGKEDGGIVFPGFNFNIGKFVRVFDPSSPPKVSFDTLRSGFITHLLFKGYLDGNALKVRILETPPGGQQAVERVYTSGPKKGQVEAIKR